MLTRSLLLAFWGSLCLIFNVAAQAPTKPVAQKIEAYRTAILETRKSTVFQLHRNQDRRTYQVDKDLADAVFLQTSKEGMAKLLAERPDFLRMELPSKDGASMELLLYRAEIFTDEFEVFAASNRALPLNYIQPVHYWGVIEGRSNSMTAISISPEEIMGFVQDGEDHYTLGKLRNSEVTAFYRTKDLRITEPYSCGTDDDLHRIGNTDRADGGPDAQAIGPDNCVNMYIEVDYDLVVRRGSVNSALNYVTGIFGQAAILYANESINFDINQILVWDSEDPYTGPGTSSYLSQFRNELGGSFNGDLAHLVGDEGSGGIAYVDVLCNASFGVGYSDLIYSSYSNVPVYSWPVEVVTHEIGHNLGSPHTHACAWGPSGDEPIDCCGPNAGYPSNDCGSAPCNAGIPSKGTIMSYCHISPNPGIDFNLGFGQQPGDLIRNRVYNANCLSACTNCDGSGGDNDGDGVCANEDCDDNDPLAYPGAPCNDGDDCTNNDVMDDNCNCAGTPATFGPSLELTITLDNYPEETSWDIRNSNDAVVASGGPYSGQPDGSTITQPINLAAGTYAFTIYDGYGDGMCCNYGQGSYTLESGGSTIASGGAFANSETTEFCIAGSDPCAGLGGDSDGDGTCDANDGCPDDPDKIAPGDCGCGVDDTDSDSDGTADCNDGCPNDPGKTDPGTCGCGTADTDSDFDGVADCNDGCPDDPAKVSPGQCGCGIPDVDSDFDGFLDCYDNCPDDPSKSDPGICGCGVPDTDADGDGTLDCDDACPNDPDKTAPGDCGCGVPDVDSDGDGTADCADECPDDPDKTSPGDCGCGVPDVDTDGDGTADCADNCPNDPGKTEPGTCGCGTVDSDSDFDGVADCNDGCPDDPAKISPGDCGCGIPDIDSDFDGLLDCNDNCPNDPSKTDPGICGCGVPDTDTDGDGTPDCNDACPNDPDKIEPGDCGCGITDVDSDSDGTADCADACPDDPDKINPGDCGCGVPDTDSDGDGTADCTDGCPNDPGKTDPGTCGCGTADDDSDGDGIADCNDGCPDDPGKTDPGICGCDTTDADSDGDGTVDCIDACPGDPAKTDPGICGCGVADADSDGDSVVDCDDVCPGGDDTVDVNGNGVPDACDCFASTDEFPDNPLTHSGNGSSATTYLFAQGSSDAAFTISGLDAQLSGRPSDRFDETVTVTYHDGSGNAITYGSFSGSSVISVDVVISGEVQQVTVALSDGYDGNVSGTMSVSMSSIDFCGGSLPCTDSDGDGICDDTDNCPGFDDGLLGTSCDDADECTIDDVWTTCATCEGNATGDSDGDGVCDALDICPGGNDNDDADGDGIPDLCDGINCQPQSDELSPNPLTHTGSGSATATVNTGGNTDIHFTISGIDSKLNGKESRRYIEKVTVEYTDDFGQVHTYGTFQGDQVATVDVVLPGVVQSVTVWLADIYSETTESTMSVDFTSVTSCGRSQARTADSRDARGVSMDAEVYPNPTNGLLYIRLDDVAQAARVEVYDMLGSELGVVEFNDMYILPLDLAAYDLNNQFVLIRIQTDGGTSIVRKVMVLKE